MQHSRTVLTAGTKRVGMKETLGKGNNEQEEFGTCDGLTLAGCQVATKATLSLPFSAGQGRKNIEKTHGQDTDRERLLAGYCHGQSRLELGKLVSFITRVE